MASPDGHAAADLMRSLRDDPAQFELHQFLRLLPLAGMVRPDLSAMAGLGFAGGDVVAMEEGTVVLGAFGLTGPAGILPRHLTARLVETAREGDSTLAEFLDLLSSRLADLLHEAWLRGDIAAARERDIQQARPYDTERARAPLAALAGLVTDGLPPRVAAGDGGIDADGAAYFASLLGTWPRSADGLARLLSAQLSQPVTVAPFHGGWVALPTPARARLGAPTTLGDGPACGTRRWEVQTRLSITIGPTGMDWLRNLTPPLLETLHSLVRLYLGDGYDIELRIRVRADDIPETLAPPARLGLDSWLGRPRDKPMVDDSRLRWPAVPLMGSDAP